MQDPAVPMNHRDGEQNLLQRLAESAAKVNYSPEVLISPGLATARWQKKVTLDTKPPWPDHVEVEDIKLEHFAVWPNWGKELVPAGCRWERLQ
jgi:hypothetical protein